MMMNWIGITFQIKYDVDDENNQFHFVENQTKLI